MRKKTYADALLEAEMFTYSRAGYALYKEAAELGLRGRYIENLLYKEAHRDILEAQELMMQESFFMESESVEDVTVLVEEAAEANASFTKSLKSQVMKVIKLISTLMGKYNEHAKTKREEVDVILAALRTVRNFEMLGVSEAKLLERFKQI